MGYRLYVGSVACDTTREVAEKYAYGLTAFEMNAGCTDARGCVVDGQCQNPGFLSISGSHLYAGCEFTDDAYFVSYRIDRKDGSLHQQNRLAVPGAGLCQINTHGNHLFGAEFWTGNVISCTLEEDGSLGAMRSHLQHVGSSVKLPRQAQAHVHSVYADKDGCYLVACDLGMDKLVIYRIMSDGTLEQNENCPFVETSAGVGPRHFVFHPVYPCAYLITEMSDEVFTYTYDKEKGVLQEIGRISGLAKNYCGPSMAAEIRVSANGRFLYTSHRQADIISLYSIERGSGLPTRIAEYDSMGKGPRSIALSPGGGEMAIANRDENLVVVCAVDQETGALGEKLWQCVVMEPCCVVWDKFDA